MPSQQWYVWCGRSLPWRRADSSDQDASGQGERWGKLVVFSEPSESDLFLDGSRIVQTPLWLERVKAGRHKLRIGDLEEEVYLEEGKALKVRVFKGRFVSRLFV